MLKIGDFSKKTDTSIETLRYYDQIDLLKPAYIDIFTNYRYYDQKQIDDLKIIKDLKSVGFSLEEIKNNWNKFNNDLMLNKKVQLLNEIDIINDKIRKIDYLRSKIVAGRILLKEEIKENKKVKKLF